MTNPTPVPTALPTAPTALPTAVPTASPTLFSQIIDLSQSLTQGFAVLGGAAGDYSGYSVASAGDVNKDGYADVIIGAPHADPSSRTNAGESYVI